MRLIALFALIPCATIILAILWLKRSAVWAGDLWIYRDYSNLGFKCFCIAHQHSYSKCASRRYDFTNACRYRHYSRPDIYRVMRAHRSNISCWRNSKKLDLNPQLTAIIIATGSSIDRVINRFRCVS